MKKKPLFFVFFLFFFAREEGRKIWRRFLGFFQIGTFVRFFGFCSYNFFGV
jgi:hypothetical protein